MPDVKLTDARRLAIQVQRVKGTLEMALLESPVAQDDLRALIKNRGIDLSPAELIAVRDALIADGTIEIV